MIPIIFDNPILTGNGYGRMADAISCTVTHEINGQYELAMEYAVTGQYYDRIENGMVLFAAPDPVTAEQPFRIYRVTRPLNGVVTVYARHIAYDMSGISVLPFTASSLSEAFSLLPNQCVPSCPFTFTTTRSVASRFRTVTPMPLWSLLGGVAGSFLDVYGGEWDFNGLTASLPSSLGQDNGVSVRYGKNMTELEQDITVESTWAAVLPFWYNEETGQLVKTEQPVPVQGAFGSRVLTLDFSEEWEEAPTPAQLTTRTQQYITANRVGEPQVSWKVNMAMLDQSEEYKGLAILERVQLGDTVTVVYEPYGIDIKARAVMIEYDVLAERYRSINLGRVKQNLAKIVASTPAEITAAVNAAKSALERAIDVSTDFITHGTGYMRFIYNDDKVLQEIVSLDNPDINQAQSVWRWNNGGFGHSSTGYAGPYTVAMTQDGAIVADFITVGTLSGDRVRAGIITDVSGRNYWNLNTGEWKNVAIETTLENLQEQIDNNIETFTGSAVPTLTNYPANAWTTTEEKDKHIGDLYVVNSQGGDYEGFYYRFEKTGSTYQWRLLKDTEVTKALADAEEALRRVGIAETQIEQNAEAITLRATKTEAHGYANTAQANAISTAASDATTKANAAESAAKSYADAQITVSADVITSNVSATYETKNDSATKLNTAKTYAEGQASAAERGAKNYTDGKLADYSTTAQMNSAITQSAASITSTVSATYETKADATSKLNTAKTYAETQASAAEDAANDYTDGKLVDYSTTTQMESAIKQTASSITSTVSATYETKAAATQKLNTAKTYAETQAADAEAAAVSTAAADATTKANAAEAGAKGYTDNKLTGYSTTAQMNSAISQSASEITSTVAATYTTKEDFNNLAIGGRNYAWAVDSAMHDIVVTNCTYTYNPDNNGEYVLVGGNVSGSALPFQQIWQSKNGIHGYDVPDEIKGQSLLFHAEHIEASGASPSPRVWLTFTKNNTTLGTQYYLSNDSLSKTVTVPADAERMYFIIRVRQTSPMIDGETLTVRGIKLEKGNKVTDWTPAPEDAEERITKAEAELTIQANEIASKVSETYFNGNTIASKINQTATTVKINAQKIDLQGAVTISDFNSSAQATLVKNTTTKNQYAQSASSTTAPTSGWQDAIPAYNATNKYIWIRVETKKTFADNSTDTSHSTPVVDINLTKSIQDAATAQITATDAASTAAAAQTKANAALVTSVSVYFRASTSTAPGKPTAEVTSTAVDTSDAWTLCMPRPKKGTTYYTCEQNKDGNGTVTWTAVRQMANATYVASWASSANATYIDGANIYTGTVTADKIAANEIFTQKLTATDFTITGGKININTGGSSFDVITLTTDELSRSVLTPVGIRFDQYVSGSFASRVNINYAGAITTYQAGTSNGVVISSNTPLVTVRNGESPTIDRTDISSTSVSITAGSSGAKRILSHTGLEIYAGTSKYSALIWPDSNGAGRFILGDGTSTKWRTELTNSGLVFRDANDNVTARYQNVVTTTEYTPSNQTLQFITASKIKVRKAGSSGALSFSMLLSNPTAFAAGQTYTILTLPVGHRPFYPMYHISCNGKGSPFFIQVNTDGTIVLYRYSGTTWDDGGSGWMRLEIPIFFANP